MSVLLYGIAADGDVPVAVTGLLGRPLREVRAGSLVAIVSDDDGATLRTDAETLWQHERVVEHIAATRTVLPARFGSRLDDDEAVVEMLDAKHEQLTEALARTRGAVELALSARWQQPSAPAAIAQTGTGYMNDRLAARRRAREVAAELKPLGKLSRSSRCVLPPQPAEPMRCAYLVDDGRVGEFTELVQRLDERLAGVELVCTGPWPPYSFTEGVAA
jgi:Gas vesicle synthesis protein GvpL/GvpF